MLTNMGIDWEWEDAYQGKRGAVDTGSPDCALRRRTAPSSTRANTLNALPLTA